MNYRLFEALGSGANFFFGFCVLCGAAAVYYRSKPASLWVALAGAAFCAGAVVEWMLSNRTLGLPPATTQLIFTALDLGRHVILFGGLALGMRTVALRAPR